MDYLQVYMKDPKMTHLQISHQVNPKNHPGFRLLHEYVQKR